MSDSKDRGAAGEMLRIRVREQFPFLLTSTQQPPKKHIFVTK